MKTKKLSILHDDNSSFLEYTSIAWDYSRDDFVLPMVSADDYLYVGYEKPINALYIEMSAVNTVANTLTIEFHNGTAWGSVADLYEDTRGMTRSGFTQWSRNQTDEALTTINSIEKYWYRISASADFSTGTSVMAINLVLSDDNDLKGEWYEVLNMLPSNEDSFILKHVASRNQIIQKIRNDGKFKTEVTTGTFLDIDVFDLLQYDQLRQASKYLTLSKIFFNLHDDVDDVHLQKSDKYNRMYIEAVDLFYLDLDKDNDGIRDYLTGIGI